MIDITQVQPVKVNARKLRYAELLGVDPKRLALKTVVEHDNKSLPTDYLISDGALHYYIEQNL